jgi:hypothetical protein
MQPGDSVKADILAHGTANPIGLSAGVEQPGGSLGPTRLSGNQGFPHAKQL